MRLAAAALLALATRAHAHLGHGEPTAWHWHATDTVGFVVVGLLAALALWMSRGD